MWNPCTRARSNLATPLVCVPPTLLVYTPCRADRTSEQSKTVRWATLTTEAILAVDAQDKNHIFRSAKCTELRI